MFFYVCGFSWLEENVLLIINVPYRGFLTRMVYLQWWIVEIYHSGWKPLVYFYCMVICVDQILEEFCQKNGLGSPVYQLHSTMQRGPTGQDEFQLFLFKVMWLHYGMSLWSNFLFIERELLVFYILSKFLFCKPACVPGKVDGVFSLVTASTQGLLSFTLQAAFIVALEISMCTVFLRCFARLFHQQTLAATAFDDKVFNNIAVQARKLCKQWFCSSMHLLWDALPGCHGRVCVSSVSIL